MRKREIWRERARVRRAVAKGLAEQKAHLKRQNVRSVLNKAQTIITSEAFAQLAKELGVETAPQNLFQHYSLPIQSPAEISEREFQFAQSVFDFVIAWKFFFPMLTHPKVKLFLEENWPGFILEMKDTFIAIVMDGPFPQERRTQLKTF